jgi:glyceraldehyde-3-phosphate dehydrogenase/erythrose-4-phosphate dehydrogenase
MSAKPSPPDSPAISSPAFNETSGDKRKVRTGPAALPVNGINDSGTSQRRRNRFTRLALERTDLEVVAVNDITDPRTLAHLLAFDSTFGRLGRTVEYTPDSLIVGGIPIAVLSERDPAQIDWGKLGADVVIESTGKFRTREGAELHLKGGARKILISAPGKDADLTIVLGVNGDAYDPQRHDVISNASCTTNCAAPMVKVLNDEFGVVQGFMTTVHAAGSGLMAGILRYSTDPLVSRDIIGDSASCVFDSALTQASGTLVKVFGWYDNEWGYPCRLADLAALVGGQL